MTWETAVRSGLYRRRIGRLIATCREIGVTPVFLTQPLLFQDDEYGGESGGGLLARRARFGVLSCGQLEDAGLSERQLMDTCGRRGPPVSTWPPWSPMTVSTSTTHAPHRGRSFSGGKTRGEVHAGQCGDGHSMNAQLPDDRSWPRRFIFPAGCAAAAAGCLMLAAHLLASPRGDPVLVGRYSPRLAAAVLILAVIAAACVSAASGGRFSRPVRNASGKIPGWVASLSLFLPAPLLFVAWFAFPAPLLDRWYGIAACTCWRYPRGSWHWGALPPRAPEGCWKGWRWRRCRFSRGWCFLKGRPGCGCPATCSIRGSG